MPTLELPGVQLSYQREGAGPTVLWVQGVGLGGRAWAPQVNRLVMSATHDPIALPVYGRRLADAIGNARFLEVPDASHALPVQLPDLVHAELHRHFVAHST